MRVSSYVALDSAVLSTVTPPYILFHSFLSRIPYWKGLGADSEEKREPVSDIDTVVVIV